MRTRLPLASLLLATATAHAQSLALQVTPLGPAPDNNSQLALTADGHAADISSAGSRQSLFIDGIEGPVFSSIKLIPTMMTGTIPVFSADGKRLAYLATDAGNHAMMVVNHKPGPAFDDIRQARFAPAGHTFAYIAIKNVPGNPMNAPVYYVVVDAAVSPAYRSVNQLEFSSDGIHVGWAANVGQGMQAVIDGKAGPILPGVSDLHVAPDGHFAYFIRPGADAMVAYIDGQPGPTFALLQNLVMSADGKHTAYRATIDQGKMVMMLDGKPGDQFLSVDIPHFSPDGNHLAYRAMAQAPSQRATITYAVVDGKKSSDYSDADVFTFSPDSARIAYVASHNGQQIAVLDGTEGDAHQAIDRQSLHFSPDGKHFAYVAQDKDGYMVVVDNKPGDKGMFIDGKTFQFSPDGQHYRYLSRGPIGDRWILDGQKPADGDYPQQMVTTADWHHVASAVLKQSGEVGEKSMHVLLDGKPIGREYTQVEQISISPDGNHLAFVAYAPGSDPNSRAHVVIDAREGPGYGTIQRILWSPDSQHLAYAAEDHNKEHVVVDDFPGPLYDQVMGILAQQPNGLEFRPDGALEFIATADKKLSRYVYTPAVIAALPKAPAGGAAGAPGYSEIHRFGETENDGATPHVLTAGKDGTLFGATSKGGEWTKGTLFKLKPDGSGFAVVHPFEGNKEDGEFPNALFTGPDGAIYGSTGIGGPTNNGTLFRVGADGTGYKVIHGIQSGEYKSTLMAIDHDNNLYTLGGPPNKPTITRMKPDGTDITQVYPPAKAQQPKLAGPFADGGDGTLYGAGVNALFKIKIDTGEYAVVHTFAGQPRDISSTDVAPILGTDGNLYGFARSGGLANGGVIYKTSKEGSDYALILNPKPGSGQIRPVGLVDGPDNLLYAIVRDGIATLSKDGKDFKVIQKMDGGGFQGNLLLQNNALFGVLSSGGKGNGSIFRYGLGGGAATAAPTLAMQIVPPTPLDTSADIQPGTMAIQQESSAQPAAPTPQPAAAQPAAQPQPAYSSQQPAANTNQQPATPQQQQQAQQTQQNRSNRGQNQLDRDAQRARDAANALRGLLGR